MSIDKSHTGSIQEPVAETTRRFHDLHRRLYSVAQEDTPVEIVTLLLPGQRAEVHASASLVVRE